MSITTKLIGCRVTDEVDLPNDWDALSAGDRDIWVDVEWETFMQNNTETDYVIIESAGDES
jgi:hypothetical protein